MRKLILKRLYVQYNYQIKKQSFKNKKTVRPYLRHSLLSRLATKPRSVAYYVLVKISANGGEWQRPPDHNIRHPFCRPNNR